MILVFGKVGSCRAPNLGCSGGGSPKWFDVLPKNSAWDMMHEWAPCCDEAANHQLPINAAIFIVTHLSTNEEYWGSTPHQLFGLEGCTHDGQQRALDLAATLPHLLWAWRTRQLPLGWLGLHFQIRAIDLRFVSGYELLDGIWLIGSGLIQVISNCSTMFPSVLVTEYVEWILLGCISYQDP